MIRSTIKMFQCWLTIGLLGCAIAAWDASCFAMNFAKPAGQALPLPVRGFSRWPAAQALTDGKFDNAGTGGYLAGAVGALIGLVLSARSCTIVARSMRKSSGRSSVRSARVALEDLQGLWQDSDSNVIEVSGTVVQWHGSTASPRPVYITSDGVSVAGSRLACLSDNAVWQFPDGTYKEWMRPLKTEQEENFRSFKDEILSLRQQLWAASKLEDFETADALREELHSCSTFLESFTQEEQQRLAVGRQLTTGVCFVHREWNHRGVIIACEPWQDARAASGQGLQDGKPGYYCLVDERNAAKGQLMFFKEDEIMPTTMAFPLQNSLIDELLVPCPEIGGYLPRPKLQQALERQHACRRFNWSTCRTHD